MTGSAASAYLIRKQAENKERVQESTPKFHFWAVYIGGMFVLIHTTLLHCLMFGIL